MADYSRKAVAYRGRTCKREIRVEPVRAESCCFPFPYEQVVFLWTFASLGRIALRD